MMVIKWMSETWKGRELLGDGGGKPQRLSEAKGTWPQEGIVPSGDKKGGHTGKSPWECREQVRDAECQGKTASEYGVLDRECRHPKHWLVLKGRELHPSVNHRVKFILKS